MVINITSLQSALVSTVLMAVLTVAVYVISLGDIFSINWRVLINLGAISILTGIVSLIKTYLTNTEGKAMGLQVK